MDNLSPAVGDRVKFTLTDPDGGIDLTQPPPGQPPPILWNIELSTTSTGPWVEKNVGESLAETFTYTIVEGDTDKYLRASVTYIDERGPGKSATSMETEAITAHPSLNVKLRFTSAGTQNVEEGDTGRTVGVDITASDRDMDSLTFGILDGPNADNFVLVMINSTTVKLKTAQALDFEMTSGLMFLQVAVHDGKGLDGSNNVISDDSIDATTTVTINIIDVEEDGVVTLSDDEPGVGTPLTTMFADGDGGVSVASWQWARSANGRTVWTNISGATNDSSTTTLADADFFLRARIEYTDRRGGGKSAEAITTERVFGENQRPTFPSTESGARTVEENSQAGVSVGDPVAAENPEGDRLVYTLVGVNAAAFTIVESTGQLRTSEALNFETKPSYSVTVEVHDGRDGLGNISTAVDDSKVVTVTVENVEEQGTITLTSDTATIQARVPVTAVLSDDDGPSGVT